MKVSELRTTKAHIIDIDASIADVAREMRDTKATCIVVMVGLAAVGVISQRELVYTCLVDGHVSWKCKLSQHMKMPPYMALPNMEVDDVIKMMCDNEIS